MNVTLIALGVAVISALFAYLSFTRARNLKKQLARKDAKLVAMTRNLQAIMDADQNDQVAVAKVDALDREIANAKTKNDAARIRSRFVSSAFNGL